jgi:hypothetical protein
MLAHRSRWRRAVHDSDLPLRDRTVALTICRLLVDTDGKSCRPWRAATIAGALDWSPLEIEEVALRLHRMGWIRLGGPEANYPLRLSIPSDRKKIEARKKEEAAV